MGYIVLDESGDLGFDFTKEKIRCFHKYKTLYAILEQPYGGPHTGIYLLNFYTTNIMKL